jgi:beta-lactamase regulating signal transducer with metallopeptidase domain
MDADVLRALTSATIASTAAVLLVGLLRKPLRIAMGARAAYWLWLLVPALMLASLLPAPAQILYASSISLPAEVRSALAAVVVSAAPSRSSSVLIAGVLTMWVVGACAMFALLLRRQRSFARSLGTLLLDANGIARTRAIVAPMLVGAWHPRIVLPLNFESHYSEEERELVLAHERAHLFRRDTAANAIASAWLCLFWFNPAIYWAIGWLRIDQELACDAQVLAQRWDARRCYANALLKTQLATESGWRIPVGCHWQSSHSLKERIVMLKRPLPGTSRQRLGIAFVLGLAVAGSYAAWAVQPIVDNQGPRVLVTVRLTTIDSQSNDVNSLATQYVVHSGETPPHMKEMNARPLDFGCTPFLPDERGQVPVLDDLKARRVPVPVEGQILLECTVRVRGEAVWVPWILTEDGKSVTVDVDDNGDALPHYKLEASASTSEEEIVAAKKAAENTSH